MLVTYFGNLGKSCSFVLPRVPFVNCRQFMYLVISLLVLRAGCGIWLCRFLIVACLFTMQIPHQSSLISVCVVRSKDDTYRSYIQNFKDLSSISEQAALSLTWSHNTEADYLVTRLIKLLPSKVLFQLKKIWQNKQNNLCAKLRLRSAWASFQSDQSSLCAQWVAKDPMFLHAEDQTDQTPRLIWVFAGHTGHFVDFGALRLKWKDNGGSRDYLTFLLASLTWDLD